MTNIHILKPGCNPDVVKANKTNLQLRELQMLRSAIRTIEDEADILTADQLVNNYTAMAGHLFFVFNSAKCFDDELDKIVRVLCMVNGARIVFVSNDCRLKIDTATTATWNQLINRLVDSSIKVFIATNATTELDAYAKLVAPKIARFVPCLHIPLDMLPCWLRRDTQSEKTRDLVFCCMHFKDYDKRRKQQLQQLQEVYGDRLIFTGDMEGLLRDGKQIESIVTDTKDVSQWYAPTKVAPVILEAKYSKFGVQPNRLSESLMNNCAPVVLTDMPMLYRNWFATASTFDKFVKCIDELLANEDYRQTILEKQQAVLELRKSLLLDRLMMFIHMK